MRKQIFGRHLSRGRGSREALFKSLVRSLVLNGAINTTLAKAKAIAPEVDKTLKLVRKNSLASKKQVLAKLGNDREVFDVLFGKYLDIATKKQSGFTRIIKMAPRRGDMAAMARLEMVEKPVAEKKEEKKEEKKAVKESKKKEVKEVKKIEKKADSKK